MIRFRNALIKNLIKRGIPKASITYTRAEKFDVVIVRDQYESMFFLNEETDHAEIIIKKAIEFKERAEVLERLNELNKKYGLMNFSLLDNRICARMWTKYDLDDMYSTYQKGLEILKDF